jgi:pyruvate dehydrogenase E1 component alpha subunit
MYAVVKEAAERARKGEGPTLIEAFTYRLGPHTSSDDPTIYRKNEEVEEWKLKDPLIRFKAYMIAKGLLDDKKEAALDEELEAYVKTVFEKVEKEGPIVAVDEVFDHTFATLTDELKEQKAYYVNYVKEVEGK